MQQQAANTKQNTVIPIIMNFLESVLAKFNGEYCSDLKQRITSLLDKLPSGLEQALQYTLDLIDKAISVNEYESEIQKLESKIRKHIKIEIELKLYYQHLQQRLEEEAKKYAELQSKFQEKIKDQEKTQIKFGSQVVSNHQSLSNHQSNSQSHRNKDYKEYRDYKDCTNKIKSKLQFHDMTEFTKRVQIKPFAERTFAQKTVARQPSNSLKNLKQGRSGTRKSDAELIKIIASGRTSMRIHHSSSRGSIQTNRRSISNSNLKNQSIHRNSKTNLK